MGQAPTINPVVTIGDVQFVPAGSDVPVMGVDVLLDRIEIDVGWAGSPRAFSAWEADYMRAIFDTVAVPVHLLSRGNPVRIVHADEVDAYPVGRPASSPTTRRGRRRARGRARAARAAHP